MAKTARPRRTSQRLVLCRRSTGADRAVATISAPFEPKHIGHLFAESLEAIEERGAADIVLAGRRFTVSREFVRDLAAHKMKEAIAGLGRPLLIFHSPADDTVEIENAARIYKAARHPKSFISFDDADHLLLEQRDSLYVGSVLAAWARRYIDRPAEPTSRDDLREDNRVATRTAANAFRTEIVARGHSLVADKPIGPLDAGQRGRLLEIADRCPVHQTLSAGVRIATELVEEAAGQESSARDE